jgi:hypothetical protein
MVVTIPTMYAHRWALCNSAVLPIVSYTACTSNNSNLALLPVFICSKNGAIPTEVYNTAGGLPNEYFDVGIPDGSGNTYPRCILSLEYW